MKKQAEKIICTLYHFVRKNVYDYEVIYTHSVLVAPFLLCDLSQPVSQELTDWRILGFGWLSWGEETQFTQVETTWQSLDRQADPPFLLWHPCPARRPGKSRAPDIPMKCLSPAFHPLLTAWWVPVSSSTPTQCLSNLPLRQMTQWFMHSLYKN